MASQYFLLPHERSGAEIGTRRPGRPLLATALGLLGGGLAAAGTRLPLATLPGLGGVGYFDYQAIRAAVCLGIAVAVALCCLARFFRLALLGAGLLCGLLVATGLDLQHSVQEFTAKAGPETADVAGKVIQGIQPEIGAGMLLAGCLLCVCAGFLGLRMRVE